jgi:hypothetical protein
VRGQCEGRGIGLGHAFRGADEVLVPGDFGPVGYCEVAVWFQCVVGVLQGGERERRDAEVGEDVREAGLGDGIPGWGLENSEC